MLKVRFAGARATRRGINITPRASQHTVLHSMLRSIVLIVALVIVLGLYLLSSRNTTLYRRYTASPEPAHPACVSRDAEQLAECAINLDGNLQRLNEAKLISHLATSETFDGFTLTVWRAYGDANRIAISYTLQALDGRTDLHLSRDAVGPNTITLSDQDGRQFRPVLSRANGMGTCALHACTEPLAVGMAIYDAYPLPPETTQTTLQLMIPNIIVGGPSGFTRNGPWHVNFTVSLAPARVVPVEQTVVDDGVPLTLQQVLITPFEARLDVRGMSHWDSLKSRPQPRVLGEGWPPLARQVPARFYLREDGVTVYQIYMESMITYGEWSITLQFTPETMLPQEEFDARSWTFPVRVSR